MHTVVILLKHRYTPPGFLHRHAVIQGQRLLLGTVPVGSFSFWGLAFDHTLSKSSISSFTMERAWRPAL